VQFPQIPLRVEYHLTNLGRKFPAFMPWRASFDFLSNIAGNGRIVDAI
jgi:hypothetical protein